MTGRNHAFLGAPGVIKALALLASLCAAAACAPVNSAPFAQLATSSSQASQVTSQLSQKRIDYYQQVLVTTQAANAGFNTSFIMLDRQAPFVYGYAVPPGQSGGSPPDTARLSRELALLGKARSMHVALLTLNDAFNAHMAALQQLAANTPITADQAKAAAASLSGTIKAVAGSDPALAAFASGDAQSAETALISKAIQDYTAYRQRRYLIDVVKHTQGTVSSYAALCLKLLEDAERISNDMYIATFKVQGEPFGKLIPRDGAPLTPEARKQREAIIGSLLGTNSQFESSVRCVKALHDFYQLLPDGYSNLALALEKENAALPSLNKLVDYGKATYDLYKALSPQAPQAQQPSN